MNARFHPGAWLLWLLAVLVPTLLTRNPLYLSLLLGALLLDLQVVGHGGIPLTSWRPVLRLAVWLTLLSVGINVLTVHHGTHVWLTLPHNWPLVGGPLTLEALLFGLASALALITLLLLFTTFNAGMDRSQWLRLVPGFLFQAGLIASIALAFVPATVQAARDTYDAQRLRGHRFRRLSDYVPLFVPVLVDSLERSVQLAESMASRGFGANLRPLRPRTHLALQAGLWLGLLSLLVGLFARAYWRHNPVSGWALIALGVGLLSLTCRVQGRRVQRTRYRRWYWRPRDTLLTAGSLLLLAGTGAARVIAPRVWLYYPYPPYPLWPDFQLAPGLLLLAAALPALLAPTSRDRDGTGARPDPRRNQS